MDTDPAPALGAGTVAARGVPDPRRRPRPGRRPLGRRARGPTRGPAHRGDRQLRGHGAAGGRRAPLPGRARRVVRRRPRAGPADLGTPGDLGRRRPGRRPTSRPGRRPTTRPWTSSTSAPAATSWTGSTTRTATCPATRRTTCRTTADADDLRTTSRRRRPGRATTCRTATWPARAGATRGTATPATCPATCRTSCPTTWTTAPPTCRTTSRDA
jgi:hypothetical protein